MTKKKPVTVTMDPDVAMFVSMHGDKPMTKADWKQFNNYKESVNAEREEREERHEESPRHVE